MPGDACLGCWCGARRVLSGSLCSTLGLPCTLMAPSGGASEPELAEAQERAAALSEEVAANESEAGRCRADIAANEAARREIQARIEATIDRSSNANVLKILNTFRIQVGRGGRLERLGAVRLVRGAWVALSNMGAAGRRGPRGCCTVRGFGAHRAGGRRLDAVYLGVARPPHLKDRAAAALW